ncbi:MAG TPA: GNAT family N-acetyltransferase [Spirochaetia bacterium]|nr:GNAT family N-acetyltransferase [Spirochaetia bacterium]
MNANVRIREFLMTDYDAAYALWEGSEGIGLSAADTRENIQSFLLQNPGLSFVAESAESSVVGALLASCDGRRGFLYHCAVAKSHRGQGIGRALVDRSMAALAALGMRKCHIFVLADNLEGRRFWQRTGWEERKTILVMSKDVRS